MAQLSRPMQICLDCAHDDLAREDDGGSFTSA